jgi:probable addiction module antidote protein
MEKSFNAEDFRDNPSEIARYLTEILEQNDLPDLVRAIGRVMRAQNVVALSEETGLRRENLYRMFAGDRDPTLGNTIKMLRALGVELVVKPRKAIAVKQPRPKAGRPRSKQMD